MTSSTTTRPESQLDPVLFTSGDRGSGAKLQEVLVRLALDGVHATHEPEPAFGASISFGPRIPRLAPAAIVIAMPEGPEIRLAADRLARSIKGKIAVQVWFAFDRLKRWEKNLSGRRIRAVEPRGKAMLVRFAGDVSLYSHNQLYGRWYVTKNGKRPRTLRQLRVAIDTRDASALLYSASEIEVLRDRELASHPYLARLGADVLDRAVQPATVRRRLDDPRFARRRLGGLLLDQAFLGGIGNYLRSEILFAAGIDPARRPCDLDDDEKAAFARAALNISRRAYRTRGVTNAPAIVRELKARRIPRRDHRHYVFGRDDEPCYVCSSDVEKLQVAGRRLYRCRRCQQ
jgi:endonuclease-8